MEQVGTYKEFLKDPLGNLQRQAEEEEKKIFKYDDFAKSNLFFDHLRASMTNVFDEFKCLDQ